MIADATAAGIDTELDAMLHTIHHSFGDVRSAGDVLGELSGVPGPSARRAW